MARTPRSVPKSVVVLARARTQARGVATRRRVLQAAESLFARRGYEATSMADVAERASVGVGTLYHHFPDKRALLLALIDDWGDRELAHGRNRHDADRLIGAGARAAFGDDLRASYERLCREGGFYLVLLELAERDSDARQRLNRINQVADERLRDLLALGQKRGVIRAEIDPLAASVLVRRSIEAAATEVFVHRMTDPAPERMLEGLTDMICRYIFTEETR
ncbi:MAG TPA: helix-turn-helix domain-containing protein [Myxococcota bacterium]|nr:helix-turn-helix domain-containing protein [Myxococcota bacterium]